MPSSKRPWLSACLPLLLFPRPKQNSFWLVSGPCLTVMAKQPPSLSCNNSVQLIMFILTTTKAESKTLTLFLLRFVFSFSPVLSGDSEIYTYARRYFLGEMYAYVTSFQLQDENLRKGATLKKTPSKPTKPTVLSLSSLDTLYFQLIVRKSH